jgi:hypothetical protein
MRRLTHLQGELLHVCCTSSDFKRRDDEREVRRSQLGLLLLRAHQITRAQRAETLTPYLLLFFGLRARYRSRSPRWSPSRGSRTSSRACRY